MNVLYLFFQQSCRFLDHAMGVIQSVGNLVASFADPPANRKFDLDLGLNNQPKDIQDKHYQVIVDGCVGHFSQFYGLFY